MAVSVAMTPAAAQALIRHHTAAGQTRAAGALLRPGDLGHAWKASSPPPARVPPLACVGFRPATPRVVEDGAAASSTFSPDGDGPFVSQTAYAYATPGARALFWRAVVRAGLLRCVARSFVNSSGNGVHFAVGDKRVLPPPRIGVPAMAYRVIGTATVAGQPADVYLDAIVLGGGAAISEISLAGFGAPPQRSLELRLARVAARRLAS